MIAQGCRYSYGGWPCIAMETTDKVMARVSIIDHNCPYPLRPSQMVPAEKLKPQGMRYHCGETPSGKPEWWPDAIEKGLVTLSEQMEADLLAGMLKGEAR